MARRHSSLGLAVATGMFVTALVYASPQPEIHIRVDDVPRPVAEAVRQVERAFGRPVTYEDVGYVHPDDIGDVTLQVRRDGKTSPKVFGMRPGSIDLAYAPRAASVDDQIVELIERVLAQSRAAGNTGDYRVARSPSGEHHVIPVATKGLSGRMEPFTPLLDTRISLERRTENGHEAIGRIVQAVTARSGRNLEEGILPTNRFFQRQVTQSAQEEPARDVLLRVIEVMGPDLSWQLLCDAGEPSSCALNVYFVRRKPDR